MRSWIATIFPERLSIISGSMARTKRKSGQTSFVEVVLEILVLSCTR